MSIQWQRLSLCGFGRFESTVTVELGPGINVIVADNERGKSTLLAGLTAVLFGLPASSDANEFGQAKYKNWNDPLRFEGELQFAKGAVVHRVRRNFANHGVTVSVQTEEGWSDRIVGEHNPRARRRNVQYEQFLKDTVGIVNAELFWNVFAFGSPLPEADELDTNIQQLLSGAGSGHYTGALERLRSTAFQLTKFSKALGIAPRDRGSDGELEQVITRATQLEQQLQSSRHAVDEQQQLQAELHDLQEQRRTAAEQLRDVEAALEAWTAWRDARTRHRRALSEQSRAVQAWEQYNRLDQQAATEELRLRVEFPELQGVAPDVGGQLERLRDLEARAEAEQARVRAEIAAKVRRGAEKLSVWHSFVGRRDELVRLQRRLDEQFAVFDQADEQTLGAYAQYEARRDALERQVTASKEALERSRAEADRRAREQARFEEAFGDLADLDESAALQAIEERLATLQHKERLVARRAALNETPPATDGPWHTMLLRPTAAIGVVIALLLAFGAYTLGGWSTAVPTFVAVVAGFMVLTVSRARRALYAATLRDLTEQLDELQRQLGHDDRLGPFSAASAHELGALSQRLVARRQAAAALATDEVGPADHQGALAALRAEVARAEAELKAFVEQVTPGVEQFGHGVAEAYREWMSLRAEEARGQTELQTWALQRFGVKTLHPEDVAITRLPAEGAAAIWADLGQIALMAGQLSSVDGDKPATIGDLIQLLPTWTGAEAAAVVAAAGPRELELDGPLQRSVANLRQQLETVLVPVDGDVAEGLARWQRYQAGQTQIEAIRAQQKGLLAGQGVDKPETLHERALDAGNRAAAAREQMEQLSKEHAALPEPDDADDGDTVEGRLSRLREQAATLRARETAAAEQYRALLERQAVLAGTSVINIAGGELELARLRRRQVELEFEIDTIGLAYRELVAAAEEYERTHRQVLADGASKYVQQFTGRRRRVQIDEQFKILVQDPDGPLHAVAQLSQGARDQLYLAVRLAIADFVADESPLPLLLDDPFVHCDTARLERIRTALRSLQARRQVVLFSHREDFASWGHTVQPDGEGWHGG